MRTGARWIAPRSFDGSEEAEGLAAVADQEVLGLLVVVEHHLVRFATDARLLVATEGGMSRIGMVAVRPDATRLDGATEPIGAIAVAGPHAGAEAIEGVVRNRQGVVLVLEGRDGDDR